MRLGARGMTTLLTTAAEQGTLNAYAYSYPHKSSYRALAPPIAIADAWRGEDVSRLSLYVHVPFCEMRCGFCNLFTQSQPVEQAVDAYLDTLVRQMRVVSEAVPAARFAQFAMGGGTPTYLKASQLRRLFGSVEQAFETSIARLNASVEVSPATTSEDRLSVLRDFGVQRISMGVQSFLPQEARSFGRPQQVDDVRRALELVRKWGFPILNIDLIYGDPDQSVGSWLASLEAAMAFVPEELYLYPLYIRPETGLARAGRRAAQHRSDLYQTAREFLGERGYEQASLRCFRLPRCSSPANYECQRDGMIGLGCGARSYTRGLHYGTKFAVTQAGVSAILSEWTAQSDEQLALATHGVWISPAEQRRRYLIMSLLQAEGVQLDDYFAAFSSSPALDVPELDKLRERAWLDESTPGVLRLNDAGMEHSDEAGPLLYSPAVRRRLEEFAAR
jgi:oxygen-independent coproporphyrinogen-3 oxidase